MNNDPIVSSVRQVRDKLASKFGNDVHAIFADMQARESEFGDRRVREAHSLMPNTALHSSGGTVTGRGQSTPAAG